MSAADDLQDFLDREFTDAPEQTGRWRIDSVEKADWAIARLRRHEQRRAAARAAALAMTERITRWLEREEHDVDSRAEGLWQMLREYHRDILEVDPRRKTVRLPSGTLVSRAGRWRTVVEDPDALIAWLKENRPEDWREFIKVSEKVVLAAMAAEFERVEKDTGEAVVMDPATGEALPGVHAEREERTFDVPFEDEEAEDQ